MPEILLHYIWQRGIFKAFPQYTTDGRRIEVLSVGEHNTDAGPDFSNAHLLFHSDYNTEEWWGNIEIHIASSDWYKHKHHTDPAYDHIVLHVVRKADKEVFNTRGEAVTMAWYAAVCVDADNYTDPQYDASQSDPNFWNTDFATSSPYSFTT